jgi:hypothetical protein
MDIDPFDERDLYNPQRKSNNVVSTTISTIVVHGGPLQLTIALLKVRDSLTYYICDIYVAYHVSSML